jgi:16S rRNA (guanine1207-N2)-methyltransferase
MSHYFDANPAAGHAPRLIEVRLAGHDFVFETDQAVFSRNRLDFGSSLLLETIITTLGRKTGRLLDLGCGYGAVGIVLKRVLPALDVTLCDINERAVALARANALRNQARFLEIVVSDALRDVAGPFDIIATNPPIRAGKQTVYRFFAEAAERLRPQGVLYVVMRKQQGAPSALNRLRQLFAEAAVIERSAGYWVIRATGP